MANGTIGLYDKQTRIWRVKSKHSVTAIQGYDLDGDGVPELISGWANGKFEVRAEKNGTVIHKDHFSSPVSAIVKSDYRLRNAEEIIVCSYNGEVRGFVPAEKETLQVVDAQMEEQMLNELNLRKEELAYELKNIDDNINKMKKGEFDAGLINPKTKVACHLQPNQAQHCVDVVFSVTNDTVIKGAVFLAEQLFENESNVIYTQEPTSELKVHLCPPRDLSVDMNIQVFVGHNLA